MGRNSKLVLVCVYSHKGGDQFVYQLRQAQQVQLSILSILAQHSHCSKNNNATRLLLSATQVCVFFHTKISSLYLELGFLSQRKNVVLEFPCYFGRSYTSSLTFYFEQLRFFDKSNEGTVRTTTQLNTHAIHELIVH